MAQYEDLIIDQGSDVEIKLELFNPDGSAKILNKYVEATNSIVPLFAASGKIKKGFNSTDSNTYDLGTTTLSPRTSTSISPLEIASFIFSANSLASSVSPSSFVASLSFVFNSTSFWSVSVVCC